MNKVFKKVLNKAKISYLEEVQLTEHSNWKIGGPAQFFVEPESVNQIKEILPLLFKNQLPFIIIGYGSNLLFDDKGYRGLVIKIAQKINNLICNEERVIVESGVWVPCFIRELTNKGYTGLEHIAGIPGSLGGLIAMNGGSNQKSISENINKVWTITKNGIEKLYNVNDCEFSYRSSIFQRKKETIVRTELNLNNGNIDEIRKNILSILNSRKKKFPLKYPNCGSVFISNPAIFKSYGSPGSIIEQLGLKGFRYRNAKISKQHGNFIVNIGNASSNDVLYLINTIVDKVKESFNIILSAEIKYVHPIKGIQEIQ